MTIILVLGLVALAYAGLIAAILYDHRLRKVVIQDIIDGIRRRPIKLVGNEVHYYQDDKIIHRTKIIRINKP